MVAVALPALAHAVEPARVQADSVRIEADDRVVEARGHVRVDAEPFHLQSDALTLTRSWRGIEIDGSGKLSFCRCLSFPLALSFRGGAVAPPYDLVLNRVKLELFGLPLFFLPILWIRAPARAGLLMPELAYRGKDGLYGSVGGHLPLSAGSLTEGIDVRVGGYVRGGFAAETRVRTRRTTLNVRLDTMRTFERGDGVSGAGVTVDARGVAGAGDARMAWDADMLIGRRALYATTALESAARPYDRGRAEAFVIGRDVAVAVGVRTLSTRGAGLEQNLTGGPYATASARRALGERVLVDGSAELGVLGQAATPSASYLRGEAGLYVADHAGPLLAELRARAAGSAFHAAAAASATDALDGAASSEASIGLPLARGFGSGLWPMRHRLEPKLGIRVLTARGRDPFGVAAGRGLRAVRGEAAVAEASVLSSTGRLGTHGAWDLEAAGGIVGVSRASTPSASRDGLPAARIRQALSFTHAALLAEGAVVGAAAEGVAVAAHGRLGRRDGVSLRSRVFAAQGLEPTLARLLVDPLREAPTAYTGRTGVTGGASLRIPFTAWLAAEGGADADLTLRALLGARAGLEIRDRCGCFVVRLSGSQRLGRDGTDVWLAVDLMPAGKI